MTSVLWLACAALSASPRSALADATPTATATATPTATPIPSTRLGNISTRAVVESGENVLIGGFIVTGTKDKKVLIRGLGPSLSLAGHLDDPTLEVRDANGDVVHDSKFYLLRNDDWKSRADGTSQQAEIEATGIPPTHDFESAILATLPAYGAGYTVFLKGSNGGTGIGVVEVYDLEPTSDSKLANISTRGVVSTGDDVMIAGTIVLGPGPQKVIIRGIGPSLQMVAGMLSDPTLKLVDANGAVIDENDNWQESADKQAIIDSGLQPGHPLESAIMAKLPGNKSTYTAIVHGVDHHPADPPILSRIHFGSGNTVEVQRVQLSGIPIGGTFQLIFTRPASIVSGQPGDKAALEDSITIPWDATADEIKAEIMKSSNFYKYDQNNHLTDEPKTFNKLFGSGGGGLDITGNEGSLREPIVTGTVTNFTIQFGNVTSGNVGTRNTWIMGLPLVQVDDSAIIHGDTGVGVVEVYALQP